jgi:hypothetical protein
LFNTLNQSLFDDEVAQDTTGRLASLLLVELHNSWPGGERLLVVGIGVDSRLLFIMGTMTASGGGWGLPVLILLLRVTIGWPFMSSKSRVELNGQLMPPLDETLEDDDRREAVLDDVDDAGQQTVSMDEGDEWLASPLGDVVRGDDEPLVPLARIPSELQRNGRNDEQSFC